VIDLGGLSDLDHHLLGIGAPLGEGGRGAEEDQGEGEAEGLHLGGGASHEPGGPGTGGATWTFPQNVRARNTKYAQASGRAIASQQIATRSPWVLVAAG